MKTTNGKSAQIRYSPEADVLYILLATGEEEYFEEPIPGVHLEYDSDDRMIGIEILNASTLNVSGLEFVKEALLDSSKVSES